MRKSTARLPVKICDSKRSAWFQNPMRGSQELPRGLLRDFMKQGDGTYQIEGLILEASKILSAFLVEIDNLASLKGAQMGEPESRCA